MAYRFRHALCNEVFEKRPFSEVCKFLKKVGYQGIEIAPFTLAEDPGAIPLAQRREYRSVIEGEGLKYVGLHWLMVSPKGLHVTTPDKALRERSWEHIRRLIDLSADLGPKGVMVFGSPVQRGTTGGINRDEAARNFVEGLRSVAHHAQAKGVLILVEALPKAQTDVINTLAEAAAVVREIGAVSVQTMFDTHNAVDEKEAHAVLVDRYFSIIHHIHVNEMDGRHPGTGSYDFKAVLEVLKRRKYQGWVSLEVFDFKAGAEKIATDSLRYLESEIAKIHT